jgi:DNA-binding NarL/FixJ family response regulator
VQATGGRAVPGSGPVARRHAAPAVLRVVLADDDADFALILRARLNLLPGLEVVATAADGRELLAAVDRTRPDAVVIDLLMPVVDGYAALERLRADHPGVGAVAYTALATATARERVAAHGAELVVKSRDVHVLADAIRRSVPTGGGSTPGSTGPGTR